MHHIYRWFPLERYTLRTVHGTLVVHTLGWICVSCFQTINSLNGLRTTTTAPNPAFRMHVHTNKRFFICYTKVNIDFVLSTCTRHHLNDSSHTLASTQQQIFLFSSARLFVLVGSPFVCSLMLICNFECVLLCIFRSKRTSTKFDWKGSD